MPGLLKKIMPAGPYYEWQFICTKKAYRKAERRRIKAYRKDPTFVPVPHHVKESTILDLARQYSIGTLIETGTFLGEMIEAISSHFRNYVSIELSEQLAKKARFRFKHRQNVQIICGDSSVVLPEVVKKLDERAIFFLDGHYSGGITAKSDIETPVIEEIRWILNHKIPDHIIVIDDARLFIGRRDYPDIDTFKRILYEMDPDARMEIENDCIIILLGSSANT
jgi:hypothetical protein